MQEPRGTTDELYAELAGQYAAALGRLARSYELDPDKQRDLLQEIHLALWRSLKGFQGTCSLRTWVYRVAHNVAASHVIRQRRHRAQPLVGLDEVEATLVDAKAEAMVSREEALGRLYALIHRLKPPDRQIILLYLEGSDAASIADITGLLSGNVATRIHRIKHILAVQYQTGSIT